MSRRQSNYVRVDPSNPEGAGQCDLCGRWYQLRTLRRQAEWAGTHIFEFNSLRCEECWDTPNEQLRTIILPVDPEPLLNSRVPNFAYEEQTVLIAQNGGTGPQPFPNSQPPWAAGPQLVLCDQSQEVPLIMQYLTSDGQSLISPPVPTPKPFPVPPAPNYMLTEGGQIMLDENGQPMLVE